MVINLSVIFNPTHQFVTSTEGMYLKYFHWFRASLNSIECIFPMNTAFYHINVFLQKLVGVILVQYDSFYRKE